MEKFFEAFPDYNPDHPRRRIKERAGQAQEREYHARLRDWVTKNASRMIDLKEPRLLPLPSARERERAHKQFTRAVYGGAPHQRWGMSPAGKAVVDPVIEAAKAEWTLAHPGEKVHRGAFNLYNQVRAEMFRKLPEEEQKRWRDMDPDDKPLTDP